MSLAVLFPGQGSQFVGMGGELFEARPDLLGADADQILGWSLSEMCLRGPEDELTRTEHAQPAIFAVSYALLEAFRAALPVEIGGAAGHSLGEYTALAASGALSYNDALAVVARRGRAMARAADLEPSGMAALIGADADLAEAVAARRRDEGGRLEVANLNAPGQVVVAGSSADIEWVVANSADLGVRRAVPLKVGGAFHSAFMEPASSEVGVALDAVSISAPGFPVWSNTTARPHEVDTMKATLQRQVVSTVRFAECLTDMSTVSIDTFVHVGPGDVTAAMAKRSVEGASVHVVSSLGDIPGVVASIVSIG
ncbi:MAG TPA: ACP S-malonyltransferase [Acidimicrobiia bacterium]